MRGTREPPGHRGHRGRAWRPSYVGRPPGWREARVQEYEALRYHQPSDEYDGSWDLSGAVDDLQLLLVAGLRIADATALPRWEPGDEFEAARKAALAKN